MASEKEKMHAGDRYDASDPELVAARERARALTGEFNRTPPDDPERRRSLLSRLFGSLGDGCEIEPPFHCDYGENIHVGENVYANVGSVFLDVCRVEIGANCKLGPGVHVYAATHPLDPGERATGVEYGKPVTVGENVWVGGRAVLTPGVSIGDDTVVGAGAIVTEDVPAGVVVQGNPATVVDELE